MKKKLVVALLVGMMVLAVGCGSKEGKVTIGEYKGLELTNVTQETVNAEITATLAEYAELVEVDRPAEEGDTVNINFVGTLDGVAFEGGTADDKDLVLGSNSLIDGFEDGLIGAVAGENRNLNLTFPTEYSNNPDLAGKDVVFAVTVNAVKESVVPQLTDEFVAENIETYTTVEEYTAALRDELNKNSYYDQIIEILMNNSEVVKYPEDKVNKEKEWMVTNYTNYANYYASYLGVDLETALYYFFGIPSVEELEKQAEEVAYEYVKSVMILNEIASIEKIELSDEEYQRRAAVYAEVSGYTDIAAFEEALGADNVRESVLMDMVMEFIIDQAVIVDSQ